MTLENRPNHHELVASDTAFWGNSDAYQNYQKLLQPLNEEELRDLAHHPKRDKYRLNQLILRAAADRNSNFRATFRACGLRKDPYFQPAMEACDYQLDGDKEALKRLVNTPGIHGIYAMAYVDEWSQTILAIEQQEKHVDGAMGVELGGFWITREQLFPKSYRENIQRHDVRRLVDKRLGQKVKLKLDSRNRLRTQNTTSILTPAPPRVESIMTIQPSIQKSERALGQA